jgi:hypothetical protein
MISKLRNLWATSMLVAVVVAACLWPTPQVEAGETKYSNLGNILDAAADTTGEWNARYNGAGFMMTWTDEDSATVAIQSTIDGSTWFTLYSALVDGGTTGPFVVRRAINTVDFANTSNFTTNGGAVNNLPLGYKVRAIVTASGSDTLQAVKFMFLFAS